VQMEKISLVQMLRRDLCKFNDIDSSKWDSNLVSTCQNETACIQYSIHVT